MTPPRPRRRPVHPDLLLTLRIFYSFLPLLTFTILCACVLYLIKLIQFSPP